MNAKDIFTEEEIRLLLAKSDWLGTWEVLKNWLWIAFALMIVALFPNPLTIILALFIIGGKQLGCAIIMHDAAHYSLFKNKKLNKIVGNWCGAYPIWHNVEQYRPYHLQHHRSNGTSEDPDLKLALNYPVTLKSFIRKIARDLSGVSGVKGQLGVLAMHLGYLKYNLAGVVEYLGNSTDSLGRRFLHYWKYLKGTILFNGLFFAFFWGIGYWWLYLIWIVALLTTYQFSIRIRSMSEHSMTPDLLDPVKNVRTTKANFFEKILFAPLNVNFHVEHHLLMNVPAYRLPTMHRLLVERGYYKEAILADGYWSLIQKAVSLKP